ncbi:NAD(P)H-binding protein [Nonomuraea sp. KM90]|uniref:NAD(P)H-binding protein n=1 Tax=Nonomuraea sp. KM90 TaxID=3457428 RepID=UPI003FCCE1B0
MDLGGRCAHRVFGATGVIGSRVVAEAARRGHQVTAFTRDAARVPSEVPSGVSSGVPGGAPSGVPGGAPARRAAVHRGLRSSPVHEG